ARAARPLRSLARAGRMAPAPGGIASAGGALAYRHGPPGGSARQECRAHGRGSRLPQRPQGQAPGRSEPRPPAHRGREQRLLAPRPGGNRSGGVVRLSQRPLVFADFLGIVPAPRDRGQRPKAKGTGMLRSLLGACHFSRVSAKVALSISFVPLIVSIFWAGVLFSGAACSSCDSWRLNSALDFKPAGKAD